MPISREEFKEAMVNFEKNKNLISKNNEAIQKNLNLLLQSYPCSANVQELEKQLAQLKLQPDRDIEIMQLNGQLNIAKDTTKMAMSKLKSSFSKAKDLSKQQEHEAQSVIIEASQIIQKKFEEAQQKLKQVDESIYQANLGLEYTNKQLISSQNDHEAEATKIKELISHQINFEQEIILYNKAKKKYEDLMQEAKQQIQSLESLKEYLQEIERKNDILLEEEKKLCGEPLDSKIAYLIRRSIIVIKGAAKSLEKIIEMFEYNLKLIFDIVKASISDVNQSPNDKVHEPKVHEPKEELFMCLAYDLRTGKIVSTAMSKATASNYITTQEPTAYQQQEEARRRYIDAACSEVEVDSYEKREIRASEANKEWKRIEKLRQEEEQKQQQETRLTSWYDAKKRRENQKKYFIELEARRKEEERRESQRKSTTSRCYYQR